MLGCRGFVYKTVSIFSRPLCNAPINLKLIRKVDLLGDMKFYRRHEINFSATWKTFLATWKSFGDMKFIFPTWNHFCSDMSQFLATWNFIGDMKSFSRRHEILSATWNHFLGDMNQHWSTWNYFGDMKLFFRRHEMILAPTWVHFWRHEIFMFFNEYTTLHRPL